MPRRLLGPSALLALLLAACDRVRPDPVVLALGDQAVRLSDFERHLKAFEREGPVEAPVRRALFDSFVEERLLVLEARRRGLLVAVNGAESERDAVQRLLAAALPATVPSADAIARYYQEHRAELRQPESVSLHQILVTTENEARDVLRRLQKDPTSFAVLARSVSRAPEASKGGQMGSFARGQLPPELEAAAFALPAGRHSGPVQTAFGFHVLRVDERQAARERSLEECRDEIKAVLDRQLSERAFRSFVQELLARAKVNHEAVEAGRRAT